MDQVQPVLERLLDARADEGVLRRGQAGVARDQVEGVAPGHSQQPEVLYDIGNAQFRLAMLPGAEELPRPAQFEVLLGHLEAVGSGADHLQALLRVVAFRLAEEQEEGVL